MLSSVFICGTHNRLLYVNKTKKTHYLAFYVVWKKIKKRIKMKKNYRLKRKRAKLFKERCLNWDFTNAYNKSKLEALSVKVGTGRMLSLVRVPNVPDTFYHHRSSLTLSVRPLSLSILIIKQNVLRRKSSVHLVFYCKRT